MAEPAAVDGAIAGGRGFCTRCAADVSALPFEARFCNRCGTPLPAAAPDASTQPLPPAPQPFAQPLILLAYANALFNLGCRYETAIGSRRNLEEAARCYEKAARLGNPAARARYGPLLEGTKPVVEPSPPFATVVDPGTPGQPS